MRNRQLSRAVLAALSSAAALSASHASAGDIAFDGTLRGTTAGSLNAVNGSYAITQNRGLVSGTNLFHSFEVFNLDAGETAVFSGNPALTNIISRVTGGIPTTIDGTIRSTIAGANFWMVNPAGLTVGATGAIDVSGAIALGAADSIDFADGRRFFGVPGANDGNVRLMVASPVDFGFLGRSVAGKLVIQNGELLTRDTLVANERQIQPLASNPTLNKFSLLLSGGTGVSLQSAGDLTLADARVRTGSVVTNGNGRFTGPIDLTAVGSIDIQGSDLMTSMAVGASGGDIFIQGGELVTIGRSSLVAQSVNAGVSTGDISIKGAGVLINDQTRIATQFRAAREATDEVGSGIIAISSTGASAETAPQALLNTASEGAVRIVDSAVLATNVGARIGHDLFGSAATIKLGNDVDFSLNGSAVVPGSNHVVIAGSVIATDATQGGIAGLIRIDADQSVWIGDSHTGGYRADGARSNPSSTLSGTASTSALGAGEISIRAGNLVTVEDAQFDVSNSARSSRELTTSGGIGISTQGRLQISDTTLRGDADNGSSGAAISLFGETVHVSDSTIGASTTVRDPSVPTNSNGGGGRITIVGGADSMSDGAALQIEGTTIRANATNNAPPGGDPFDGGILGGSGGEISLETRRGTLQISNSKIEGKALGPNSGLGGSVSLQGASLEASNLDVSTAAETQNEFLGLIVSDPQNNITFIGTDSIVLSDSTLTTTTSGAAAAGDLSFIGRNVDIRGSTLQTTTTGSGNAGRISALAANLFARVFEDRNAARDAPEPASFVRITDSTLRTSTSEVPAKGGGISVLTEGPIDLIRATLDTSLTGPADVSGDISQPGGSIELRAGGRSSVSIVESTLRSTASGIFNGSDISIEGGSFLIRDSTITSASNAPDFGPEANVRGGDIDIHVSDGLFRVPDPPAGMPAPERGAFAIESSTIATSATAGDAGDITLSGLDNEFVLRDSKVLATAGGHGLGGAIDIDGMTQATVRDSQIQSLAQSGVGGAIRLSTGSLLIDNTNIGSSASAAAGGAISIDAGSSALVLRNASIVASAGGSGVGGNISIDAGAATLQGSQIQSLADAGVGGAITLTLAPEVSGTLQLDGTQLATNAMAANGGNIALDANGRQVTLQGSSLVASAGGAGDGGNVSILNAAGLSLRDAQIQATTVNGTGGAITIGLVAGMTEPAVIENTSITTRAVNAGGGNISFDAAGHQVLVSNSAIVASAGGAGTGGGIAFVGADSARVQDSQFQALADAGVGGTISFTLTGDAAGPLVFDNSTLMANASRANGGSIALDAAGQQVVLRGSTVVASAGGSGVGGGISIVNAGGATLQDSQIQALAESGAGGTISIALTNTATAPLALDNSSITTNATNSNGGSIALDAGGTQVTLRNSNILASAGGGGQAGGIAIFNAGGALLENSQVQARAEAGRGGTINLHLDAAATGPLSLDSSTITTVATSSNGGSILLDAAGQQVAVHNSNIVASAGGAGIGGDVSIANAGSTTIQGTQIQALAQAGAGGTVNITRVGSSGGALLIDGSNITTNAATADGGSILLDAAGQEVAIRNSNIVASAGGAGKGGDIEIANAGSTTIQSTQIQALAQAGTGGTVTITRVGLGGMLLIDESNITTRAATADGGSVALDAAGNDFALRNSTIAASSGGAGTGGDIAISNARVPSLVNSRVQAVANSGAGGTISLGVKPGVGTALIDNTAITTYAGNGKGGNVGLDAAGNQVVLRDSYIVASAGGTGPGGDIAISNAGGMNLLNTQIQALAAAGSGGTINLALREGALGPLVMEGSSITTNAVAGSGGNITLSGAGNPLTMRDSTIRASAGAAGTGGNVVIDEVGFTIIQRSQVLARADSGHGGAIGIDLAGGALLVRDAQSLINADSNSGNDGAVDINSPDTDLNPAVKLQDAMLETAPELSASACDRARKGARSTLVRETRGGVSIRPDGYLATLDLEGGGEARVAAANEPVVGVAQASVAMTEGCR